MKIYVFDTSPLSVIFRHYYPDRFPSLWKRFNESVLNGRITSTREVYRELTKKETHLMEWRDKHKSKVFPISTFEELAFVNRILSVPNFKFLVPQTKIVSGEPVADPFVIARAKCLGNNGVDACVVTLEKAKENAAKIPNVCAHFGIDCVDLEGFMEREKWRF